MIRDGSQRMASVSTILLLTADPLVVRTLRLDVECREIEDKLAKAPYRTELQLQVRRAAKLDDFVQALNDYSTTAVLQFSGHGVGPDGISLHGEDGCAVQVSSDAFVELIAGAAGENVVLVVLNACHTEDLARALVRHFPCVVGTSAAIGDLAAIAYSRSLHRALASGRSVANAHEQGSAAARHAQVCGPPRDVVAAGVARAPDVATLLTKPDIDAGHVYISGPETRGASTTKAPGPNGRAMRRKRSLPVRART